MHAMLPAAALLGLALPCLSVASQKNGDVRLVGSVDYYYSDDRRVIGRLLVYYNGQWGNVFGYNNEDEYFGYYDSEVACDQLGGLDYYYYDDDGLSYEWPEDTGLLFLQNIECDGIEHHLSECAFVKWIANPDEWYSEDYVRSISCIVPPAEDVVDPEFVLDVGFGDAGVKCQRADGVVLFEQVHHYDSYYARRRRSSSPTPPPTPAPTPPPTPQPTYYDFEPNLDTSTWEVAACHSVYSGADDSEVEIMHRGQARGGNEVCARRTDGQPWTDLYLRLLCRVVDLNSTMVSYTSKASCGPRGDDAVAETSHCVLGAIAVATVQSEPPIPAAVVDDCAFFSYTEYLCLEDIVETETQTNTTFTSTSTATGCMDYVPPEEEKWHDADGELFDCAWYAGGPDCSQLGGSARNFNHTADEACCTCGGGVAGPRTTTTRTATTASATQTDTTASEPPGSQLYQVTGSLQFSSTGSWQQVQAAAAEALAQLLGVPASKVTVEVSPAGGGTDAGRRLSSAFGWWQVSYTVWSTLSAADEQHRAVEELAGSQAAATALFTPHFEDAGLQMQESTLEITEVDVAGATFTDTTTTAIASAAQASGNGGKGSATTDDADLLPVILGVVAVVLAGLAIVLAAVAVMIHRSALKHATNDNAPIRANAGAAGTRSHVSEVLAV